VLPELGVLEALSNTIYSTFNQYKKLFWDGI